MKLRLFAFIVLMLSSCLSFAQAFNIVEDEPHYFFLIPQTYADRTEVGGEIAKHNHTHYPNVNFKVETVYLPERIVAFQIQPFISHSAARAYYDQLINSRSDLTADELSEQFFIISHSNLQQALRVKNIKDFLSFFRETYF